MIKYLILIDIVVLILNKFTKFDQILFSLITGLVLIMV